MVVLLAEDGDIRPHLAKQLGDHGSDAGEEVRAKLVFQAGGRRAFRHYLGGKPGRIHHGPCRRPDNMDAERRQGSEIAFPGTRVVTEILMRRELGGVDENRHHHPFGAAPGATDQGEMPGMERPHGRHQGN